MNEVERDTFKVMFYKEFYEEHKALYQRNRQEYFSEQSRYVERRIHEIETERVNIKALKRKQSRNSPKGI